jgi:hypothetical protein
MHYNEIFNKTYRKLGYNVVYQPCALQRPYDGVCWPIAMPDAKFDEYTIVIIHLQDFVTVTNGVCPELQKIEQHYGSHAHRVIVIHWNYDLGSVYSGPLNLMYFPTHSYELLINLAKTRSQWEPVLQRPKTKHWQCLNGIPRPHRRWVASVLKDHDRGVLSLGNEIALPAWPYDTYRGCENEENWIRLLPVYSDCQVNFVTETQYTDAPGIISEKTIMALLAGQVPVIIGYSGIVDHCRQLGFDMFDDIVNTEYDSAPNDQRWLLAIQSNINLITQGIDSDAVATRLTAQRTYVLDTWPQKMITDFYARADEIHWRLKSH